MQSLFETYMKKTSLTIVLIQIIFNKFIIKTSFNYKNLKQSVKKMAV